MDRWMNFLYEIMIFLAKWDHLIINMGYRWREHIDDIELQSMIKIIAALNIIYKNISRLYFYEKVRLIRIGYLLFILVVIMHIKFLVY